MTDITNSKTQELTSFISEDQESTDQDNYEDNMESICAFNSFKPFTRQSYIRLCERDTHLKELAVERAKHAQDAHLVDGELKFGIDDDEEMPPAENMDLREGCNLSKAYGKFPTTLYGSPIEEIDPGIQYKTFLVIAKRFKKNTIYRFAANRSLNIIAPWNPVRKLCLSIMTHLLFDLFIFLTIITNCVFLAMPDEDAAEKTEYVFLAIYSIECIVRIGGRGFIMSPHTYLRDPWNWLDFTVILSAYVTVIIQAMYPNISLANLQGLRTFRVLRALKTVSIVPGLKTIVSALLRAFKMLFEVILLTMFCLMVFAMFGLQVYQGLLRQKCVKAISGYVINPSQTYGQYYAEWIRNSDNWFQADDEYIVCGNNTGAGQCPKNFTCMSHLGDNPRWGYLNFDHFGWALLSCFQLITLDYWEDIYSKVIRASGPWNVVYFMIVIFFGSFYLINLMLAVVSMSYEEEALSAGKEKEREKTENAKNKHSATQNIGGQPTNVNTNYTNAANMIYNPRKEIDRSNNENSDKASHTEYRAFTPMFEPSATTDTDRKNVINKLGPNEIVIVKACLLLDPQMAALDGQLIDRNCYCCEKCCCSFMTFLKIQNYFFTFVNDPLFELTITFCIVLNTIFLCFDHHLIKPGMEQILNYLNYFFSSVFLAEAVFKILALGKYYFTNSWNNFDFVIVIASIADIGSELATDGAGDSLGGLTVLRTFRLLRVFKLAQSWPTMRLLLSIILSTLGALGNLCVILFIVIYIFAVIGLQVFREKYTDSNFGGEGTIPRWNFKTFFNSMLMIFRVLCGEWIEASYDCMRAHTESCLAVFLPALVFGNFVVLNLFLALLLNAFASDSLDKNKDSSAERSNLMQGFDRLKQILCCCCPGFIARLCNRKKDDIAAVISDSFGLDDSKQSRDKSKIDGFDTGEKRTQFAHFGSAMKKTSMGESGDQQEDTAKMSMNDDDDDDEEKEDHSLQSCFPPNMRTKLEWLPQFNDSDFGIRWTKFRTNVKKIVDHKAFEGIVLFIILGSSLTLAFEDVYLYQKKELTTALNICNYVFTILFTVEMVLKIVGLGLHVYFTHFWTILDFLIVCVSVTSIIGTQFGLANGNTHLHSLRTLRSLRPLRAISRWQGMKIVVNALMNAIPAIVNVLMVCMVFWLIFSILGVQLFKGQFFRCNNQLTGERTEDEMIVTMADCNNATQNGYPYKWENAKVNFDNTAIGFLALFQVATFEGWMEVMGDASDAAGVDKQPVYEQNSVMMLYFVVFIVFGSFFSLNLFIGVIIENFNVLKKKYEGSYLDAFLTQKQRNYYNTLKRLGKKKPQKTIKRPKNQFQLFFYNMSMNNKFELSIVILIFLNMISMAVNHYKAPIAVEEGLSMINVMFTTIFALEAFIKLIGLRLHYFRFVWNIFDFIIVILSILDILYEVYFTDESKSELSGIGKLIADILDAVFVTPTLLRIIRVFRIGRVLRLIKSAKGIRKLLFALIISLPAIFNVGALLFLIMYMYAIIGMSSFMNIKISDNGIFDEVTNFQTFGNAFMLLLRLSTSAGWNDVLECLLIKSPYCNSTHYYRPDGDAVSKQGGECGTPWLAVSFMVTYVVIVWLIVINMYIAIILENFSQAHEQEELGITEDDFDMFYIIWEKFDPHATQFIKYEQLADFVGDLEPPLQIPKPNEISLVSFNLPIMEGEKMHCLDILIALVRKELGNCEESEELTQLKEQMEAKFAINFPARVNITVKSSTLQRKKEDVAARTLQRAWRSWKAQKAMRNITALAVKQRLRRASAIGLRSRTETMKILGSHLTSALNTFFANRKANVTATYPSITNLQETLQKKQSKIQNKGGKKFTLHPGDMSSHPSPNGVDI